MWGGAGQKVSLRTQSDPVDCCILACVKGLYCDVANGIMEGACGPLLIHTNKTKTKEKEAEEQVRQHSTDTTVEIAIAP